MSLLQKCDINEAKDKNKNCSTSLGTVVQIQVHGMRQNRGQKHQWDAAAELQMLDWGRLGGPTAVP